MRQHSLFLAPTAALALLTACSSYSVKTDFDRSAHYASYRTFDWYAASKRAKAQARGTENPIMDRRVHGAVERELAAKGYRLETAADPDFLVTYYPVYRDRKLHTSTSVGTGFGRRWGYGVGMRFTAHDVRHYKEGTIVLEIVDGRSNQLVWQAVAEGALTGLDQPEEAEAQVGKAVRELLESFPPR